MMTREYVACFKNSVQISPDDFDVYHPALKLTDETTIGQIREWYLSYFAANPKIRSSIKLQGISINELETAPATDTGQQ